MPALVSSILAYQFGRRRANEDRAQRAKELATALLIELRWSENVLRDMYLEERPLNFEWYLPFPWFDKLFPELRVFSPETVRAAYEFYGLVLEIQARLQMMKGIPEVSPQDQLLVRAKAGFAVERLAHLFDALTKEGGLLPPVQGMRQVSAGRLPPLPPVIFPEALSGEDVGG